MVRTINEDVHRAVILHNSLCPGLAVGIQAGRLARSCLGSGQELTAVAESEHCALDGIQAVTGCTTGRRTLAVRDYGKLAWTFHRSSDGVGVRLAFIDGLEPTYQSLRHKVDANEATSDEARELEALEEVEVARILDTDPTVLFRVTPVAASAPVTPRLGPWVRCERCGEQVLESRTCQIEGGELLCPSCFDAIGRRMAKLCAKPSGWLPSAFGGRLTA